MHRSHQPTHRHRPLTLEAQREASDVLAPAERAALTRAAMRANSTSPAAVAQTLAWARSVRLHALMLDAVLGGTVDVVVSHVTGDLVFREHDAQNVVPLGFYTRK